MDLSVLRAVAAGGGHPLVDIDLTILIQFALFLVMAFFTKRWLFQPYLKMREQRTEGIDGARERAEQLKREAEQRKSEYESRLDAARSRALEEQRTLRAEAAAHHREVSDGARREANEALAESRAKVQSQIEEARSELMPKGDALATEIVSKLLGRAVS